MFAAENLCLFTAHLVYFLLYNPNSSLNKGFPFHSKAFIKSKKEMKVRRGAWFARRKRSSSTQGS